MAVSCFLCFLFIFVLSDYGIVCGEESPGNRKRIVPANSNWAVIVETSRYYYNYRHTANSLSFYRTIKRLGIPDSHIILYMGDCIACSPRNPKPGRVFNDQSQNLNLYGDDIEVDYRSDEVSVDSFIRLLAGRQSPWMPRSKRLLTDESANIFIFMSGHGGDSFLKFQDWEEIGSQDIADALSQMFVQKRYNRILFVADTCQAATLSDSFYSPGILAIGSSDRGENSWSHHSDNDLGVAVIDRFTYYSLKYFEKMTASSASSMQDYISQLDPVVLNSHTIVNKKNFDVDLQDVKATEFFGSSGSSNFRYLKPFCMSSYS